MTKRDVIKNKVKVKGRDPEERGGTGIVHFHFLFLQMRTGGTRKEFFKKREKRRVVFVYSSSEKKPARAQQGDVAEPRCASRGQMEGGWMYAWV